MGRNYRFDAPRAPRSEFSRTPRAAASTTNDDKADAATNDDKAEEATVEPNAAEGESNGQVVVMCPAEPWEHVMDAETAERSAKRFGWFLGVVSVLGLLFIIKSIYDIFTDGVETRQIVALELAIILAGFAYFMIAPAKYLFLSFKVMAENNGWISSRHGIDALKEAFTKLVFVVIILQLITILAWVFNYKMAPVTMILLIVLFIPYALNKVSKGPLIFTKYYKLVFNEAVQIFEEKVGVLVPNGKLTVKRKKLEFSNDEIKFIGRNVGQGCFVLRVQTDKNLPELNRRLRGAIDTLLEGRPLPEVATSAATDYKAQ